MRKELTKKEDTSITTSLPQFTCMICREIKQYTAIGICNHTEICNYCSMKSRMFYEDNKCPICNAVLTTIFIIPAQDRDKASYDHLLTQKDYYFKDDQFDLNMIYYQESGAMEESIKLNGYICPITATICSSEPFESLDELKTHLKQQHQKKYCDVCLKHSKRFISEQSIFSNAGIQSHIDYGEYDTVNGFFTSPPHPQCPFCKDLLYDEEQLYKHINQYHFICDLCRKVKKIICYSALPNLIDHYKIQHYRCPYKTCVDDLYVAFEKESELISHLVTKHHMILGNDQMTHMISESKPSTISNPMDWNIALSKDEFNFTAFVEKMNAKAMQHNQMKESMMEYKGGNREHIGNGVEYEYEVVQIEDNSFKQWKGKHKGKNKNKKTNEKYYNQHNDFNEYAQFEREDNEDFNKPIPKEKDISNVNTNVKDKDKPKCQLTIPPIALDYSFILQFYISIIKFYVIAKINTEALYESEFILQREIIYQLIIIIDKLDSNDKILQLSYLHHFGIELDITKQMANLLSRGDNIKEEELIVYLDQLTIKKILIVYKYLSIAYKKVNTMFFKLDVEQIEEDLYEDFIQRKTPIKNRKANGYQYNSQYSYGNSNSNTNETEKKKKKKNKKKHHNKDNKGFNDIQPMNNQIKENKGNLNDIFNKPPNTTTTTIQAPKEENWIIVQDPKQKKKMKDKASSITNTEPSKESKAIQSKEKSKLALLLESTHKPTTHTQTKPKTIIGKGNNFKLSNFNLDQDFPKLK